VRTLLIYSQENRADTIKTVVTLQNGECGIRKRE